MARNSTTAIHQEFSPTTSMPVEQLKPIPDESARRNKQLAWINQELENQIAERLQAEKALRQAEEKYRSIFENAIGGIFQTTPAGYYLSANPALARIYGYASPEELIAQIANLNEQLYVDPKRRNEFVQQIKTNNTVEKFESQIYRKDGSIIWIAESARAVRDASGEILYYEGFVEDITERKQAESALKQSETRFKQQAEQLEKTLHQLQQTQSQLIQTEKMSSLGQLVAGVAHEINNPIGFVCGNLVHASQYTQDLLNLLRLYQRCYPNPTAEIETEIETIDLDFLIGDLPRTLASIQIGADRIRQIVLSLRNFSRIDEAMLKPVDIHEGIDSTLLILGSRIKANATHSEIAIVKQYGDLPPVECYAGQLNQVLMNILSNAIDALRQIADNGSQVAGDGQDSKPDREPTIQIFTEQTDTDWATIRIADNGSGMPEAVRQRIFDPFFTTKPVGKGTGLGLSISYQIVVENHGGLFDCVSTPGEGPEFAIKIPLKRSKAA